MSQADRSPSVHLFRVSSHAGIWCVIRDGAFFGDHPTQADAIEAAHEAAREAQALGCAVQVFTP